MKDSFNPAASEKDALNEQLLKASENGRAADVVNLLAQGADIGARDKYKWTALHMAAHHGHDETVKTLVNAGADPQAKTDFNNTPRDLARKAGQRLTEKYLQSLGDKKPIAAKKPAIKPAL